MMEVDLEGSKADPEGNLSVWIAGRVRVPEDYIALSLQILYFTFFFISLIHVNFFIPSGCWQYNVGLL